MTGDHSKELGVETRLSDQGSNGDDKNGVELTGIRGSQRTLGTSHDIEDMRVLGKLQELRRNFRFISILGFACTLMSTWEVMLTATAFALTNGGTAGLIWTFVIVMVGYSFTFASLAEMASMAPTSGGQYHWVSEFAPRKLQRILSYCTGWMCIWGWLTSIAGISFFAAGLIQALIILNNPNYVPQPYHGTLLVIAVAGFSMLFNTFLAKKLPLVEGIMLVIHVCGFFAIILPLWILGPRANASDVFTTFTNGGGWNSVGTSTLVGMLTTVIALTGSDSAVHMSEETKDAGLILPRSLMWALVVEGVLGFGMLVTLCFTLGDLNSILETSTGFPFVQVIFNVTNSYAGTSIMVAIIITTLIASVISNVATCSRQLWSFARDKGVPFSGFISHVYPGWDIPLNAVLVSFIVTCILSLINIGSSVAILAVTSLSLSLLLTSYMVSISTLLVRRLTGPALPPRRWSLGRAGTAVNILALCFLVVFWIFSYFPGTAIVTTTTMNWNSLMFVIILIMAAVWYVIKARHEYIGPVMLVKRDD